MEKLQKEEGSRVLFNDFFNVVISPNGKKASLIQTYNYTEQIQTAVNSYDELKEENIRLTKERDSLVSIIKKIITHDAYRVHIAGGKWDEELSLLINTIKDNNTTVKG